eukprot:12415611-Karenia_brevis.AAC.1
MDAEAWRAMRQIVLLTGDMNSGCNAPSSSAGVNGGPANIRRRGAYPGTAYTSVLPCSMVESVVA